MKRKQLLIQLLLLLSGNLLYAQKRALQDYFKFDEVALSINQSFDANAPLGFGVAAYKVRKKNYFLSYVWGVEYNKSHIAEESVYFGHFGMLNDVSYRFHNLIIPLGLRVHVGNKYQWFLSGSALLDLSLYSKLEGTKHINTLANGINTSEKVSERPKMSPFALGFMYGTGFSIPLNKHRLLFQFSQVYSFRKIGEVKDSIRNFYSRFSIAYQRQF